MVHEDTPILIGFGQQTERGKDLDIAASPMDLMEQAVHLAADDAGISAKWFDELDVIGVVKSLYPFTKNPPLTLAKRIGASRVTPLETPVGGNMPQFMINKYAEEISKRKIRFTLFAGTEAMETSRRFIKVGVKPDWSEEETEYPWPVAQELPMATPHEKAHGIWPARNVYPLFENALRGHYCNSIKQHQLEMGALFSRFTDVAAETPFSWFKERRTAEEIAHPSSTNRMVGWPYTKFMNAMNQVNQSSAILMTSVGFAKKMGVAEDKWIFLHGCADVNEKWHVSHRVNYHSSPAINRMGKRVLDMATKSIEDIDYLDLYSCFPVAVEIARDELGIAKDDPRPLTVTGGLPYHGGAGSYSMNALVTMVQKLRKNPGSFGLITANGGYLSEHSAGIYSTTPISVSKNSDYPWQRTAPSADQAYIEALDAPSFTKTPSGKASIETYTVASGRSGAPSLGIVIGRLGDPGDPNTKRFIANTPIDPALLKSMMDSDYLGATGTVSQNGDTNLFIPN